MNVTAGIMHDEESYRNGIPVTGNGPTSYHQSDFIAYPEFLVLRDAPRDASPLCPIYCDNDTYVVVIVVECLTCYNTTRRVINEINSDEIELMIESKMMSKRCKALIIKKSKNFFYQNWKTNQVLPRDISQIYILHITDFYRSAFLPIINDLQSSNMYFYPIFFPKYSICDMLR